MARRFLNPTQSQDTRPNACPLPPRHRAGPHCRGGFPIPAKCARGLIGNGTGLKSRGLQVRVLPRAPIAPLAQLAEASRSEREGSGFDSQGEHHVAVAQLAEALGRGPRGCGFDSRLRHQERCRNGNGPGCKPGVGISRGGSSPSRSTIKCSIPPADAVPPTPQGWGSTRVERFVRRRFHPPRPQPTPTDDRRCICVGEGLWRFVAGVAH